MRLTRQERLLNFPPISNIRDLGGYDTIDQKFTKTHKYVRSAIVANVSDEQLKEIYEYGIRAVIDLRSDAEISMNPHALSNYEGVSYYHINLMDQKDLNVLPKDVDELSDLYIFIVDKCQHKMKEVFEILVKHKDGGVLYNCSAGKDRTGVVSALLLDLANVDEQTIITDYSESYENNLPIYQFLEKQTEQIQSSTLLLSEPEQMSKFLNHFKEKYNSTKDYLSLLEFSEEEIELLKNSFVTSN